MIVRNEGRERRGRSRGSSPWGDAYPAMRLLKHHIHGLQYFRPNLIIRGDICEEAVLWKAKRHFLI
jgi:hypothetical protein